MRTEGVRDLTLDKAGGFAGLRSRFELRLDALDDAARNRIAASLASVDQPRLSNDSKVRDAQTYTLTVRSSNGDVVITGSDTSDPALLQLFDLVQELGERVHPE